MAEALFVGQTFSVKNPDHSVLSDDWTVLSIDPPRIVFSNTKRFAVDIAYVKYEDTQTREGVIVKTTERGVIVDLLVRSFTVEVGLIIAGDQAYCLSRLDPPRHA